MKDFRLKEGDPLEKATSDWRISDVKGTGHDWHVRSDGLCFSLRPSPHVVGDTILLAQMDEERNLHHPSVASLEGLLRHPRWYLTSVEAMINVWPTGRSVAECMRVLNRFGDLRKTCWYIPDVPKGVDPKDIRKTLDEFIPQAERLQFAVEVPAHNTEIAELVKIVAKLVDEVETLKKQQR